MLLLNLIAVIAKEDEAARSAAANEVLNVLSQVRASFGAVTVEEDASALQVAAHMRSHTLT